METKKPRRKKRVGAEKILHDARRKPSPFCPDPRQLTLEGAIAERAFANLDREIERTLSEEN
jgi:hypothetical protein